MDTPTSPSWKLHGALCAGAMVSLTIATALWPAGHTPPSGHDVVPNIDPRDILLVGMWLALLLHLLAASIAVGVSKARERRVVWIHAISLVSVIVLFAGVNVMYG